MCHRADPRRFLLMLCLLAFECPVLQIMDNLSDHVIILHHKRVSDFHFNMVIHPLQLGPFDRNLAVVSARYDP